MQEMTIVGVPQEELVPWEKIPEKRILACAGHDETWDNRGMAFMAKPYPYAPNRSHRDGRP